MMKRNGDILFLALILAALAAAMYVMAPAGLASNEEGVHYIQMRNFALNGTFEITGPAQRLGFKPADIAGRNGLLEVRSDNLYAVTPPLFPWAASLFYPLMGERAVYFTPILFLFLSTVVLGLALDRVMERGLLFYLLIAAFLLGSPVFLQGFLFNGISLALLLIVLALWLLVSHFGGSQSQVRLFGASLLMGASVLVGMECLYIAASYYLCAAAILAAQGRSRDLWTVLAACACSLGAFVLHDIVLYGAFPGPYMKLMLPFYRLSPVRIAALGGSFSVALVLITLSRREGLAPLRKAVLSTLTVIIVFGAVLLTAARMTVSQLMALFPAVLLVFYGVMERLERLKKGEGTLEGILAATVVLCLLLGASILRPGAWIVLSVWLPLVPLVILVLALERKTVFANAGMSLVLAFFIGVAFVNGIQELQDRILKYREYNTSRIAFLEKHTSAGDAILFGDAGSKEHAGPLFFDRVFLEADHPGAQERLARELAGKGVKRAYVWTSNPMVVKGYNPYRKEPPPSFPFPSEAVSCCSGTCKTRHFFLISLETTEGRVAASRGVSQKGNKKENGS